MRALLILSIFIVVATAVYTFISVSTYDPPPVQPLSFDTPLEFPALEQEAKGPASNPEYEMIKDKAVSQIVDAIEGYDQVWPQLPRQAGSMQSLILQSMKRGSFPAIYPDVPSDPTQMVQFIPFKLELAEKPMQQTEITEDTSTEDGAVPEETTDAPAEIDYSKCLATRSVVLGDIEDNVVRCPPANGKLSRVISTGPGKDIIDTGGTQAFIEPGTGDDYIRAGPGQTTIILDEFEGQKKVEMDCSRSSLEGRSLSSDYPLMWMKPYVNFIVFGAQISPEDIQTSGNVITNLQNNATITFTQNCFNLNFTSSSF